MIRYLFVAVAAHGLVPPPPPPPPPPVICDPFMLFFDAGSARLTDEAQRMINNIASVRDHFTPPILVVGYADAPGATSFNLRLSRLRAEAVKAALIAKGVPASMMTVGARGESGFIVETENAEALNRRVQVFDC